MFERPLEDASRSLYRNESWFDVTWYPVGDFYRLINDYLLHPRTKKLTYGKRKK